MTQAVVMLDDESGNVNAATEKKTPDRSALVRIRRCVTNRYALLLVCVVFIGLALRIYRLADESPWLDEVLSVVYLDAENFDDFAAVYKKLNPPLTMGYATVLFQFYRHIGDTELAMRMLSITAGVLTLPIVFFLGLRMYSPGVGIVAALGLAVSKFHIYYSQELRPYALVALFGTIAMWGVFECVRSKKAAWLAITVVGNACLMWMHPLGILLLGAQLVALVALQRRAWRLAATWCLAHASIVIGLLPWYSRLSSHDIQHSMDWLLPPTARQVWSTLFFTFPGSTAHWWDAFPLIAGIPAIHYVVAVIFLVGIGWTIYRAVPPPEQELAESPDSLVATFLLIWFFVPVVMALAISYVSRSIFWDRYLIFCVPALFLILGYSLSTYRVPKVRVVSAVVLSVCYVVLLSTLSRPIRVDWRSATDYVKANWNDNDVFCFAPQYNYPVWAYYFRGEPNLQVNFENIEQMGEVFVLPMRENRSAWTILASSERTSFIAILEEAGVEYEAVSFPSYRSEVTVFHSTPKPRVPTAPTADASGSGS